MAKTTSSLAVIVPAAAAALILIDTLLTIGLGLDWAIVGLFGFSVSIGWALAAVAAVGSLAAGVWLFRRAYAAEKGLAIGGIPLQP